MTTASIISILADFLAIALLLYGFINEEKVIDFEMNLRRIILGNIRRYIRLRNQKKAATKGVLLREVNKESHNRQGNGFAA